MSGRILVVEDDERIRSSMRLALEGEGYDVRDVASGEEALEIFSESPTDVALIDIMLPGMDGFECCRALRKQSAVPIIIVTARAQAYQTVNKRLAIDLPYLWLDRSVWSVESTLKVQNWNNPTTPTGAPAYGMIGGSIWPTQIWLS